MHGKSVDGKNENYYTILSREFAPAGAENGEERKKLFMTFLSSHQIVVSSLSIIERNFVVFISRSQIPGGASQRISSRRGNFSTGKLNNSGIFFIEIIVCVAIFA